MKRAGSEVGLTLAVLAASPAVRAEAAKRGGFTSREIAVMCGCSDAYVSALMQQALAKCRLKMSKESLDISDFLDEGGNNLTIAKSR